VVFGREFRSDLLDGNRIDYTEREAIYGLPVERFEHLVDLVRGDRKDLNVFLSNQRSEGRSAYHSNRHGFRLIQRFLRARFLAFLALLSRLSSSFS
jgi:hypothetical protein